MKLYQDRDWLYQKYWVEGLNSLEIEKLYKVNHSTLFNWLEKLGIPGRSMSEARRGKNHHLWGKHHSEETKKKMSKAQRGEKGNNWGKKASEKTKKKFRLIRNTEEYKKKNSLLHKGNKYCLGRKLSEETRKKISEALKGKANPNYKNGKYVAEKKRYWNTLEYRQWRKAVFERDDYTCQRCGDNQGGNLNAHHKKPWKDYRELRFDVSNGITYCEICHRFIHANSPCNFPLFLFSKSLNQGRAEV